MRRHPRQPFPVAGKRNAALILKRRGYKKRAGFRVVARRNHLVPLSHSERRSDAHMNVGKTHHLILFFVLLRWLSFHDLNDVRLRQIPRRLRLNLFVSILNPCQPRYPMDVVDPLEFGDLLTFRRRIGLQNGSVKIGDDEFPKDGALEFVSGFPDLDRLFAHSIFVMPQ